MDAGVDLASFPRPTGQAAEAAVAALVPVFPANANPRYLRLTCNAIPAQQVSRARRQPSPLCFMVHLHNKLRTPQRYHLGMIMLCSMTVYVAAEATAWSGNAMCIETTFGSLVCQYQQLVLQAVRARFQLPLGAIAHPFADPPEGAPLPVIQLENYGIIRCRRCRTYINPFMVWSEDGRSVINPKPYWKAM